MESEMIQRWATRGGKYTIELWRHPSGRFDIYEFVNSSRQAMSANFPEAEARKRFWEIIRDSSYIDGINYRQVYPAVSPETAARYVTRDQGLVR